MPSPDSSICLNQDRRSEIARASDVPNSAALHLGDGHFGSLLHEAR